MKKIIFGSLLIFCSTMGISVLLIMGQQAFQTLGTLEGSTDVRTYWYYLGLTSFYQMFKSMGIIGFAICVMECIEEIYVKLLKQHKNK